jgi:leader peptidase (prepilin peptidase)/N-methyltransferase
MRPVVPFVAIPYPLDLAATVFLGLVFGSFATALASRAVRGISVISDKGQGAGREAARPARSACPACGHVLAARDLVPLFSWLLLRGKCRYCGARIGWAYPATELASLAACLGIYAGWGFTLPGFALMCAVPFLLALLAADLRTFLLPDRLTLGAGAAGLAYVIASGFAQGGAAALPALLAARIGAAAAYAAALFLCGLAVSKLRRREALGLGDVKFFAVAGLCLGLADFPFYLILSGVCGVFLGLLWRFSGRGPVFPFGPAIILALYLCLLLQRFAIFPY